MIEYAKFLQLRDTLAMKIANGPQEVWFLSRYEFLCLKLERKVDILHWMSRTALELVGQSGLGYSFDTLTEDAVLHPYSLSVKKFV